MIRYHTHDGVRIGIVLMSAPFGSSFENQSRWYLTRPVYDTLFGVAAKNHRFVAILYSACQCLDPRQQPNSCNTSSRANLSGSSRWAYSIHRRTSTPRRPASLATLTPLEQGRRCDGTYLVSPPYTSIWIGAGPTPQAAERQANTSVERSSMVCCWLYAAAAAAARQVKKLASLANVKYSAPLPTPSRCSIRALVVFRNSTANIVAGFYTGG